ncbi:MAG: DMT family transporter [Alphaproteobacteria bacterium]
MTAPPAPAPRPASGALVGMGWMLLSGLLFAIMTGAARHAAVGLDPMQVAFLRYSLGFLFVLPFLVRRYRFRLPRTTRPGLHVLRGVFHGIGVMLWFYSLVRIPIAEVQALSFLSPVFVTLGAMAFLGERADIRRLGAVLVAFGGTLVILRPGLQAIDLGAVALLVAAPLFAGSELAAKLLSRTESSANVVAIQSLVVSLTCLPAAALVWQNPSLDQLAWILVVAGLATLGHMAWIKALIAADVSATQPIKFLQLAWVALIGLVIFAEVPDLMTLAGGAIIFASASYVAGREARSIRRAAAGPSGSRAG